MTQVTVDACLWTLGESVGSGGFGRVYVATADGREAVVKLVPKDPGAQRELLLAGDLGGVPNIVPVIGVGETEDCWAVVMPRAEQSLRDFLDILGRPLEQREALPILLDLGQALVGLSAVNVVHRNVKPENVLLIDGRWCLTDIGVSRYAEATTAADTTKYRATRAYAAPEHLRVQQPTAATDVYAAGVVAFEMLTGRRPFEGPDIYDQQLRRVPPSLSMQTDNPLRNIVDECLTKAPQARPVPTRLLARLRAQSETDAPGGGLAALIEEHHRQISRITALARRDSEAQSEEERRADLFDAATVSYERLRAKLTRAVQSAAPSADERWPLRLGYAVLHLTQPSRSAPRDRLAFDVIAYAQVQVDQSSGPGDPYCGRMHSLWFCDAHDAGQYAWFETAFMDHPLLDPQSGPNANRLYQPYAVAPHDDVAQQAVGTGTGGLQVAWPFTPLLDDEVDDFVGRWARWFAVASSGGLQHPQQLPERPVQGSWRQ